MDDEFPWPRNGRGSHRRSAVMESTDAARHSTSHSSHASRILLSVSLRSPTTGVPRRPYDKARWTRRITLADAGLRRVFRILTPLTRPTCEPWSMSWPELHLVTLSWVFGLSWKDLLWRYRRLLLLHPRVSSISVHRCTCYWFDSTRWVHDVGTPMAKSSRHLSGLQLVGPLAEKPARPFKGLDEHETCRHKASFGINIDRLLHTTFMDSDRLHPRSAERRPTDRAVLGTTLEDWTRVSDPEERRRMQNRNAQRRSRKCSSSFSRHLPLAGGLVRGGTVLSGLVNSSCRSMRGCASVSGLRAEYLLTLSRHR